MCVAVLNNSGEELTELVECLVNIAAGVTLQVNNDLGLVCGDTPRPYAPRCRLEFARLKRILA